MLPDRDLTLYIALLIHLYRKDVTKYSYTDYRVIDGLGNQEMDKKILLSKMSMKIFFLYDQHKVR